MTFIQVDNMIIYTLLCNTWYLKLFAIGSQIATYWKKLYWIQIQVNCADLVPYVHRYTYIFQNEGFYKFNTDTRNLHSDVSRVL